MSAASVPQAGETWELTSCFVEVAEVDPNIVRFIWPDGSQAHWGKTTFLERFRPAAEQRVLPELGAPYRLRDASELETSREIVLAGRLMAAGYHRVRVAGVVADGDEAYSVVRVMARESMTVAGVELPADEDGVPLILDTFEALYSREWSA